MIQHIEPNGIEVFPRVISRFDLKICCDTILGHKAASNNCRLQDPANDVSAVNRAPKVRNDL